MENLLGWSTIDLILAPTYGHEALLAPSMLLEERTQNPTAATHSLLIIGGLVWNGGVWSIWASKEFGEV